MFSFISLDGKGVRELLPVVILAAVAVAGWYLWHYLQGQETAAAADDVDLAYAAAASQSGTGAGSGNAQGITQTANSSAITAPPAHPVPQGAMVTFPAVSSSSIAGKAQGSGM